MIRKLLLLLLPKVKSSTNLCYSFIDLAEFLNNAWAFEEQLAIVLVAIWVPLLKLAVFLLNNFNYRLNSIIPLTRCKLVFWGLYGFTLTSCCFNLTMKYINGCSLEKLSVLIVVCVFLLIMDFRETEEFLKKNAEK